MSFILGIRIRHLTIPLALLVAFSGAPAVAQGMCGTRAGMIAQLNAKYGETRRGAGMSGPQLVFEVWASEATGTWTILKVFPDGQACMMASGINWHDAPPVAFGDPV